MPLATGTRLGPYEIQSALGAGGMGEVYKARDTRLDRSVAIKVLAPDIAADPGLRTRFEREARAIAALDHPHICGIFDVGEADGMHFIVMPHLEGQTLADRLEKGPLPLDQALTRAAEIADALDKAHRQGIVHRDLKPANIMLTKAGSKLLDFGLAKLRANPGPISLTGMAQLATTSPGTARGMILGTVPYMAPEQVEGREADARSDIWALGAVTYEMVTGVRPFQGSSPASIIGAILKDNPPRVSSHQPLAPGALDHLLAVCLAKDPEDRWQSMRDVTRQIGWIGKGDDAPRPAAPAPVRRRGLLPLAAAVIGALLTLAMVAAFNRTAGDPEPGSVRDVRFSVYPENGAEFATALASVVTPQFALSPDGTHLAYVARLGGRTMLWVRPLNAPRARTLPGTEDADYPFWSPDSTTLGFFAQGNLKTISLAGGAPLIRSDASRDPRGASWAPDGTILAALMSFGGVKSISPQGQTQAAVAVDQQAGEANHRRPFVLPDGRQFLYVVRSSNEARRGVTMAAPGERSGTRLVLSDHSAAVADGRLLFVRGRTLMAQPLDVANRRLTGDAVAVVDDVGSNTTGYAAFSVSQTGVLAFAGPWPTDGQLTWFARDGRRIGPAVTPLADYVSFSLSPDNNRLAVSTVDAQTGTPDIWILDPVRGSGERLTTDPMTDANAFWSADGTQIFFRSNRSGVNLPYSKGVNDSRDEQLIDWGASKGEMANMILTDRSRDGRHVILTNTGGATSFDIWRFTHDETPALSPVVQTAFDEFHAVLSPDGRWIAYTSNETGSPQVYMRSFPKGDRRFPISSQGGTEPQWRADGRELFFLGSDRSLMAIAIPISTETAFKPGLAKALFRVRVPVSGNPYRQQYIVAPDGERFLINSAREDSPPPAIHIILDWRLLLNRAAR